MKSIIRLIVCVLISVSSLHGQHRVDSLLTAYTQNGRKNGIRANFNGVVLIAKNDKIVFHKAYGYADFDNNIKLTPNSKFLIGSMTKPIVAAMIMKQVEKRTIKLNQPITDFLPYLNKKKGKHITIHGLLSHTSGLAHYNGIAPFFKNRSDFFNAQLTPEEYSILVDKADLVSIPGTQYNYSSLGYVLLGAVLEKVTGSSFSELITTYVSTSLKLNTIGFEDNDYVDSNIVKSYRWNKGEYQKSPNRNQSNTFTAGGIHANAEALFTWTQALTHNKLLSKSMTKRLFTSNLNGYAYGWIRNDSEVLRYIPHAQFYAHGGRVNSYSSYVMIGDDGTTIVMLSNTLPLHPWKLVSDVYRVYKNEDLTKSTRIILPSFRSLEKFNQEGGIDGVMYYKNKLTEGAGYPIYPSSNYLTRLVNLHHNTPDAKAIETLIDKMITGNPNAEGLINRLAYFYLKTNPTKAEEYFKKGVKLFSKSPNAWDGLGEYYEKNQDLTKAKKAYAKAVSLAEKYSLQNLKTFRENLNRVKDEM
ncbi:serine hydrolase [Flavobacteriaceae bacterium R38]|nr:serine hydrolase [Flavobacteriaceae bacterium R38]